jgi:hypothetical protein
MKLLLLTLATSVALAGSVRAETAVPDHLVIGYDDEGEEIDTNPQACVAEVESVTRGEKAAKIKKDAREVCAARKRRVEAHAALQSNYKKFVNEFSEDRRLNLPAAVSNLKTLVRACIDHKFGLTTGGHNIWIEIIPHTIVAECLTLGSNLIKDETTKLKCAEKQLHLRPIPERPRCLPFVP